MSQIPNPVSPVTTVTERSLTHFRVRWQPVPNVDGYRVHVSTEAGNPPPFQSLLINTFTTATEFQLQNLPITVGAYRRYWLQVYTVKNDVLSPPARLQVAVLDNNPIGAFYTQSVTHTTAAFSWDETIGWLRFEVQLVRTDNANWDSPLRSQTLQEPRWDISGLTASTEYTLRGRVWYRDGTAQQDVASGWAYRSFTTLATPPPPLALPNPVTISSVSHDRVTITWSPAPDATSYIIRLSTGEEKEVPCCSVTFLNLQPNTPHLFTIRSRDANTTRLSPLSAPYVFFTSAPPPPPPPPATPTATAATNRTATSATANWLPAANATSYELTVYTAGLNGILMENVPVTGTSFVIANVQPATEYWYSVVAVAGSRRSAASNLIVFNTLLPAPQALPATNITNSSFQAQWSSVAQATEYEILIARWDIQRNEVLWNGATNVDAHLRRVSGTTLMFEQQMIWWNRTWAYRVRAISAGSEVSAWSNEIFAQILPVSQLPAPTIQARVIGWQETPDEYERRGHIVEVTWNSVHPDADYDLFFSSGRYQQWGGMTGSRGNPPLPSAYWKSKTRWVGIIDEPQFTLRSISTRELTVRVAAFLERERLGSWNEQTALVTLNPLVYGVPTILPATAIQRTSFQANWQAPVGQQPAQYRLEVARDADFIALVMQNVLVTGVQHTVTGLDEGTQYYYRVRAEYTTGLSGYSRAAQVTTTLGVTERPTALPATQITSTGFRMHWTAVSGLPQRYILDIARDAQFSSFVQTGVQVDSTTSYTLTNLSPNTPYWYRVRANTQAGLSQWSNVVQTRTSDINTGEFQALPATNLSRTGFVANWTPIAAELWSNVVQYELNVSETESFSSNVLNLAIVKSLTAWTLVNMKQNTVYYYRVWAVFLDGRRVVTNVITVETLQDTKPATPEALSLSPTGLTSLLAQWRGVPHATEYVVTLYRNTPADSDRQVLTVAAPTTVTELQNLRVATSYKFFVYARNAATNERSADSNEVAGTTNSLTLPTLTTLPPANVGYQGFTMRGQYSTIPQEHYLIFEFELDRSPTFTTANRVLSFVGQTTESIVRRLQLGLLPNTVYYYRLRAELRTVIRLPNGTAQTISHSLVSSNYETISTLSLAQATPEAPVALPATEVGLDNFRANWVPNTNIAEFHFYTVQTSFTPAFNAGNQTRVLPYINEHEYYDVAAGQPYYYRVRISIGTTTVQHSAWSNVITVNLLVLDPALAVPTALAPSVSRRTATLRWTPTPEALRYTVEVCTDADCTNRIRRVSVPQAALPLPTEITRVIELNVDEQAVPLFYRVAAQTATRQSTWSNVVQFQTERFAPPVALPATNLSFEQFVAKWQAVAFAPGYDIELYTDAALTEYAGGTTVWGEQDTSAELGTLQTTLSYWYRVRVANDGITRESTWSNVLRVNLPPPAPYPIAGTELSPTQAECSWYAAQFATSYRLDVARNEAFTDMVVTNRTVNVANTTSIVTGLQPEQWYYFRLRSVGTYGTSPNSVYAGFWLNPSTFVPPVALPAEDVTSASFRAVWRRGDGTTPTSYRLDVSRDEAFTDFLLVNTTVSSSTNVTRRLVNAGVEQGKQYWYRVRVAHGGNQQSSNSNVETLTTLLGSLLAPVALPAEEQTASGFLARWNAVSGASQYELHIAQSSTFAAGTLLLVETLSGNATVSRRLTTAAPASRYWYRVRAINAVGASAWSNVIEADTLSASSSGAMSIAAHPNAVTVNLASGNRKRTVAVALENSYDVLQNVNIGFTTIPHWLRTLWQ